jgi:hypothetical protein
LVLVNRLYINPGPAKFNLKNARGIRPPGRLAKQPPAGPCGCEKAFSHQVRQRTLEPAGHSGNFRVCCIQNAFEIRLFSENLAHGAETTPFVELWGAVRSPIGMQNIELT